MAKQNIKIVKNLSKRVNGLDKGRLVRDDKERKDKK
jgi:ABC-type ATPase involved in cell division